MSIQQIEAMQSLKNRTNFIVVLCSECTLQVGKRESGNDKLLSCLFVAITIIFTLQLNRFTFSCNSDG